MKSNQNVKTVRGVYIDVNASPYTLRAGDKILHFVSPCQCKKFLREYDKAAHDEYFNDFLSRIKFDKQITLQKPELAIEIYKEKYSNV